MRCHYENVEGVGKVLIPGCMAVAVTGDIDRCTCHPTSFASFEREKYQKEVERLKKIIKDLEQENEYYANLLESSGVTIKYKENEQDRIDSTDSTFDVRTIRGRKATVKRLPKCPYEIPSSD